MGARWAGRLPAILVIVAIHVLWLGAVNVLHVHSVFLPSVGATYGVLLRALTEAQFWLDVGASWLRVTVGFLLSFIVSYPLVLASLGSNRVKAGVFVVVEAFRYLPVPVFVPLTILWFGVTDLGKIVIVFLGTFCQMIPMFYDSALGARRTYRAAPVALKWTGWDAVRRIVIPASAPGVFDDARLCLGWAWTYLVVAELLGATYGIGYAIIRAQRYLATDRIFAYVIVIGLMGITTDRLLRVMRQRVFSWA